MLKLYGAPPTRALRVLWAVNELGLECEIVPIDLMSGESRKSEFLRLNPAAKVPVLVDGDLVLNESAAIVMYLAEKHPAKGLMPSEVRQRAEAYRWILFTVTELEQPLWRIAHNSFIYPEDKRQPSDVAIAREEFSTMAKVLERHMEGRQFIVGDCFSVADCVTAYIIDWASTNELLGDLPQLRAYVERMYARPTAPPRIAQVLAGMEGH